MKYLLLLPAVLILGTLIEIKPNLIDFKRPRSDDVSPVAASSARFPKRVASTWRDTSPAVQGNFDWVYAKMKSSDGPHVTPVADESGVYVGNAASWFYAFRPDQTLKWKFRIERAHDGIVSKALLRQGRVYFGGTNGTIYCLDEENGQVVWSATLPGADFRGILTASDETLSIGDVKIDLRNGQISREN